MYDCISLNWDRGGQEGGEKKLIRPRRNRIGTAVGGQKKSGERHVAGPHVRKIKPRISARNTGPNYNKLQLGAEKRENSARILVDLRETETVALCCLSLR